LLFQRLARLANEPRVIHRDDRLRREIFEERDLLVGERPGFAPDRDNHAEKRIGLAYRDC